MNIDELKFKLKTEKLDAFLICNPKNILYFTQFYPQSISRLVVFKDEEPILFLPELEFEEAKNTVENCKLEKFSREADLFNLIKDNFQKLRIKKCGIEENFITKKDYSRISEKLKGIKFLDHENMIINLRAVKNSREIKYLTEAAKIADLGMEKAIESIKDGITELEVAAIAEYEMRKNGSEAIPFDTIIASGLRSAFPHAKTTTHKIKNGDIVIIDLGAQFEGYVSDTSRTVILGKPSEKQKEVYNTVLAAQLEALKKCRANIKASELDNIARSIIENAHYGKFFNHSLGHGVGLDVHEKPTISTQNDEVLQENNVITIEPGIYIPELGGARIEDTVIVKENRCIVLNKVEKTKF
ncbi:MAG: M24 family metallopeptidase [Candidatus Helarchaeota archaeon]